MYYQDLKKQTDFRKYNFMEMNNIIFRIKRMRINTELN